MGLPNCSRSLAYWTVISCVRSPAPTAHAPRRIRASSRTAVHVAQPVPAAPMRSAAVTRDAVEVDPVLGVGGHRELLGERDPSGLRVDEEQVDVGLGRRRCGPARPAGWRPPRTGTCRLAPVSANVSPPSAVVARVRTPRGPWPPSGSTHAGVSTASPEAIRGSHSACWASVPPAASDARPRPRSSRSAASGPAPVPAPRRGRRPRAGSCPSRRGPRGRAGRAGRAPRAASTGRRGSRPGGPPSRARRSATRARRAGCARPRGASPAPR